MIRILESKTTDVVGKYWYYLICDEGDTKPTGEFPADSGKTIANGSRLFETGTEIRYEYNNGSWTAVGQKEVTLKSKTITENGTYDPADDEADGYSSATVNVTTPIAGASETTTLDTRGSDPTVTYYVVSRIVEGSYIVEVVTTPSSGDTTLTTITVLIDR